MVEPSLLDKIVRRIVEVAQPEKIILFGSAARGETGPNSDIDLVIIKSNVHRRRLAMDLYEALAGIGHPVDLIVARPEDIERYGRSPALVYEPALREGKVLYAAWAIRAGRSTRVVAPVREQSRPSAAEGAEDLP